MQSLGGDPILSIPVFQSSNESGRNTGTYMLHRDTKVFHIYRPDLQQYNYHTQCEASIHQVTVLVSITLLYTPHKSLAHRATNPPPEQ